MINGAALLWAHVLDVTVGSQTGVVSQIPAGMVRVVVKHNIVGIPVPIGAIAHVIGGYAEGKAAEPELVGAAAFQSIDMPGSDFSLKPSVFPGTIPPIVLIISSHVVTDLPIIVGMHVRSFRMSGLVAETAPFLPETALLPELCLRLNSSRRTASRRFRPTSRNVSAADVSTTTALLKLLVLLALLASLRKGRSSTKQYRCDKSDDYFHKQPLRNLDGCLHMNVRLRVAKDLDNGLTVLRGKMRVFRTLVLPAQHLVQP